MIPGASPESAVEVAALTETAKAVMEGSLAPLWVRGEVSDFKRHRNGHWYFSLRDAVAQVRCVVWSREQRNIPAAPDDGMEVLAYGQLTVYPARGDLHLSVTRMEARGDGLVAQSAGGDEGASGARRSPGSGEEAPAPLRAAMRGGRHEP